MARQANTTNSSRRHPCEARVTVGRAQRLTGRWRPQITMKKWGLLFFALFSNSAPADMPIVYIRESSLPYEFSPTNYDNSPANYDNSIANYDNSGANYDNSSSNYDNSPSNYENGTNGNHRLYYL